MATQYSVSVPIGTKSANWWNAQQREDLDVHDARSDSEDNLPRHYSPQPLDALMFVELDQRIDPAAVLKTIKVTAGTIQLPLRLATNEEIEADHQRERVGKERRERSLACVPRN